MSERVTPEHLKRSAFVYIRQNSAQQVLHHRESLLCQRSLSERARELGWTKVEIIDEDLGVSGTGVARRTGFETLVARVCREEVGVVLAWDASRLARNNRDWHHLLFLCVHARTLIADQEGVYDPALTNDRLLLGLKGTLGEFELTTFHQRSRQAILQKASRGELAMPVPAGYLQREDGGLEKHPDQRVRNVIESVFTLFRELGNVRQVGVRLCEQKMDLPRTGSGGQGGHILWWREASYEAVREILANPLYAGAYASGRTRRSIRMVEGEPRRILRVIRDPTQWKVLIRDHHECYITWDEYERNQKLMRESANRFGETVRGGVRRGPALLGGLLRCGRCGGRMHVSYGKGGPGSARYECRGNTGSRLGARCQSFGGWLLHEALEKELTRVLQPGAIEAALMDEKHDGESRQQGRHALELDLEAARFEAQRTYRQYDAVDPGNRVVARELERRWNIALEKLNELEQRWTKLQEEVVHEEPCTEDDLLKVAAEFQGVWTDPSTEMATKKRIVRCLIQEMIVTRNDEDRMVRAMIHWTGGIHTELTVPLRRPGESRRRTTREASDIIKELAEVLPDEKIARVVGLLGHKTGTGLTWTQARISCFRKEHGIPAYSKRQNNETIFDLTHAATYANVCPMTMHRLLKSGRVRGRQPAPYAPWLIRKDDLDEYLGRSEGRIDGGGSSLPPLSKQPKLDFS